MQTISYRALTVECKKAIKKAAMTDPGGKPITFWVNDTPYGVGA